MLPETHLAKRVPDEIVATTAVFKAPQIIEDLPYTGSWNSATCSTNAVNPAGESTAMIFPGSQGSIWHSASNDFQSAAGTGLPLRGSLMTGNTIVRVNSGFSVRWMSHGIRTESVGFLPRFRSTGSLHIEVTRIGGAGFDLTVGVKTLPSFTATTTLRYQYRVGAAFTNIDVPMAIIAGVGNVTLATIPALIDSFAIGIIDDGVGLPQDIEFSLFDLGGWAVPQNSATMYDIIDMQQLANMEYTSEERPAAVSALVTYMGSTLSNGGNIALARLPMGLSLASAPNGDYYGFIASLPIYAGDHALKEGGYVWWCPDSEQEYFFRVYGEKTCDDLRDRSSLVLTMRRDEPAQTVRLRVDMHIETQTRSALFSSEVSDYSASFPKALQIAKTFPAVTTNEQHKGFFKGLWDKVKGFVSKPKNWLDLVTKGVSMLTPLV
jgi:hypothetical protein